MKNCAFLLALLLITSGSMMATAQPRPRGKVSAKKQKKTKVQYGTASYYANKFQGRPTASGAPYDKDKMTCAHNSLPFGTWVKVTNMRNKRSVIVRVTDRLHHNNQRVVDLSRIAASKLGYTKRGLARVKVEVLPNYHPAP
ncbi:MAG TPA: septal ring lytic transglycosylase RlpA family protein [Chitinophagaceae bacterium]|nr:septal ring lytic transglycosylase RlpA family protein [Chitinophagaceae bacterium]